MIPAILIVLYIAALVFAVQARSSRRGLQRYTVPGWFWRQAMCIHQHESRDWHLRNPPYSGGMQFTDSTWHRAGGIGRAADWSPAEQVYRAYLVWRQDGGSWREWPTTRRICGLA